MHKHIHKHIHTYIHADTQYTHMHTHTRAHTHTHTHTHAYTHTYTHIYNDYELVCMCVFLSTLEIIQLYINICNPICKNPEQSRKPIFSA